MYEPSSDLIEIIGAVKSGFDDALAIVSRRSIRDIDALVAPLRVAAIGLDGIERRYDHIAEIQRAPKLLSRDTMRGRIVASGILDGGVWMEDKDTALAIHFHQAPEREADILAVLEDALAGVAVLRHGKEKTIFAHERSGLNKDEAVAAFLDMPLFAGRVPIYIGCDESDEESIARVQEKGGFGVKIGAGNTIAAYRLMGLSALRDWMVTF